MEKENLFCARVPRILFLRPLQTGPRVTIPPSLTMQKTRWGKFKSNPRSFPYWNSTCGREKGGRAYWRRSSSVEVSREVKEVTTVTSRYRSALEVVGVGGSSCAGGGVRRRRVFWPAHGGIVQLVGSESFTK
jgi:hypothetical protein